MILSCHLFFVYNVVKNIEELASFSKSWVYTVDSDSLFHDFADFAQIISMVGQRLLQTDEETLLDTFASISSLFSELVKKTFSNKAKLDENALTLYYVIKKVVNWSGMKKIMNAQL